MSKDHRLPRRLRGAAALASLCAALLLPAAAGAAINTHITIEGSGSGEVVGIAPSPGAPEPIACKWNGETEKQTGVCAAEAQKPEPEAPFFAISVKHEAAPGSKFAGWTVEKGSAISCSQGNPKAGTCSVTLSKGEIKIKAGFVALPKYALTLKKTGTGDGTVTSSPAGIECAVGCGEETAEFSEGKVTLEATPDGSSVFAGWTGCDAEPEGKCEVTISAAREVEARFVTADTHVLIEGSGSGAVVPHPGEEGLAGDPQIDCRWDGIAEEQTGACDAAAVDLLGEPGVKVAYEAAPGSIFAGWEVIEGSAVQCEALGESCAVHKSGAEIAIKATFVAVETHPLDLSTSGSGSGSFKCDTGSGPEACEAEYLLGTAVAVLPMPQTGSQFLEWSGDCSGVDPEGCSLTMDEGHSVGAVFEALLIHPLNLSTSGAGPGYFECATGLGPEGCAAEYFDGTAVEVIPANDTGFKFLEWTGDCAGSDPEGCSVTMDEEHSVGAVFDPTFRLKTSHGGTGSGTVECDTGLGPEGCSAEYEDGAVVALTAIPDPGSEFLEWTGACSGSGSCEVTMDEEHSVGAVFGLIDRALTIETSGSGTGGVSCNTGAGPKACLATYPSGTAVTLIATADTGSEFTAWSGECNSVAGNECEVEMDASKTVEVNFALIDTEAPVPPDPTPTPVPPAETCATNPNLCPPQGIAKAAAKAPVRGGKAALKLTCPDASPCKGSFKLIVRNKAIGRGSFAIAAGKSETVEVGISGGQAKKLLGRGRTVKAKLSGAGVQPRTVKLEPTKRKHRRGEPAR